MVDWNQVSFHHVAPRSQRRAQSLHRRRGRNAQRGGISRGSSLGVGRRQGSPLQREGRAVTLGASPAPGDVSAQARPQVDSIANVVAQSPPQRSGDARPTAAQLGNPPPCVLRAQAQECEAQFPPVEGQVPIVERGGAPPREPAGPLPPAPPPVPDALRAAGVPAGPGPQAPPPGFVQVPPVGGEQRGVGGEVVAHAALLEEANPAWVFLRNMSIEDATTRWPLLRQKYTEDRRFAQLATEAMKLARDRAVMGDKYASADASRLMLLLPTLLFARHRPGDVVELRHTPWLATVTARLSRLQQGEFQSLFREAAGGGSNGRQGGRREDPAADRVRAEKRSVDLAHRGQFQKHCRPWPVRDL